MKIHILLIVFVFSGCVSLKQYKSLDQELKAINDNKRKLNKEIYRVEKANKSLEDSITKVNELAMHLCHKIESRLAKNKIIVKLDSNDLKRLTVLNQQLDDNYYSSLKQKLNFNDTNSARKTEWLNANERELIYWLNYARLNPKGFCMKYIYNKYNDRETNVYIATLIDYMLSMKPVPAVFPDIKLFESAKCHAESMGKAGLIGHNRLEGCKSSFSGECCSYGLSEPLDIVIQLLIDQGVPSLGHRYICLGTYSKIGISIKPHKTWSINCVLDFGYTSI